MVSANMEKIAHLIVDCEGSVNQGMHYRERRPLEPRNVHAGHDTVVYHHLVLHLQTRRGPSARLLL
jgi:hypothetical protein